MSNVAALKSVRCESNVLSKNTAEKKNRDDHRSREFNKSIIPLVLVRHEVVITASDPTRALDVILTLALI